MFFYNSKTSLKFILCVAKQVNLPILIQAKDKCKENVFELAYRYTEIKLSKFGKKSRFSKI